MRFDKQFLMKALPKAILLYENFPRYPNVSVDSRTIAQDEIFVAFKGQRVDGHDFIGEALSRGAAGVIIEESKLTMIKKTCGSALEDKLVVVVKDSVKSLVKLATAWRDQFDIPVVGITGSVGKSSTKEVLRNILNEQGIPSCVSYGNQNSLIGVPINVLKMRASHKMAVFELGISSRGDMSALVDIVKPTFGLITCVGHSHMAGLGALADVAEEKRTIFKFFKEDNIGVINGDQALLAQIGYTHPVIKFGSKTTNQIQARKVRIASSKINFTLKIYQERFPDIVVDGSHEGVVNNILGAVSVACLLDVPHEAIVRGIKKPVTLPGRFEFKNISIGKGGILIDDCYNANPESVKAALAGFERMSGDHKKMIILSDMRELGVDSPFWHRQIGRLVRKTSSLDYLVLVGNHIKEIKKTLPVGLNVEIADDWQSCLKYVKNKLKLERLLVLAKGSTGGYTEGLAKLVKEIAVPVKTVKPARPVQRDGMVTTGMSS